MKIFIYLLELSDETWYIGMTKNPERRFLQHRRDYGSIHTIGRKVVKEQIIWVEEVANKWHARLIENEIADTFREIHPKRIIRGGELSQRFKKIIQRRAIANK